MAEGDMNELGRLLASHGWLLWPDGARPQGVAMAASAPGDPSPLYVFEYADGSRSFFALGEGHVGGMGRPVPPSAVATCLLVLIGDPDVSWSP